MADRGRDLKISILSDTSKFDLDAPAKELHDLGDASGDATRDIKSDARDIDRAFDAIATSARTNMRQVDKHIRDAGDEGFKEFKDEAHGSGREAAASFSGGFDDITGFVQETAANAFAGFGPGGAALGIIAAAGIGIATALWGKSKEEAQALHESADELFGALLEGSGKISAEAVNKRITDMLGNADDRQKIVELGKAAKRTGVDMAQFLRAMAGDPQALKDMNAQLGPMAKKMEDAGKATMHPTQAVLDQREALRKLTGELGIVTDATGEATDAYSLARKALTPPINAKITTTTPTAQALAQERAYMQRGIGTIGVPITTTGSYAAAAAARNTMNQYFYRNPVTVPLKPQPGQGAGYGIVKP